MHVAVDVKTGEIVDIEIARDDVHDSEVAE